MTQAAVVRATHGCDLRAFEGSRFRRDSRGDPSCALHLQRAPFGLGFRREVEGMGTDDDRPTPAHHLWRLAPPTLVAALCALAWLSLPLVLAHPLWPNPMTGGLTLLGLFWWFAAGWI